MGRDEWREEEGVDIRSGAEEEDHANGQWVSAGCACTACVRSSWLCSFGGGGGERYYAHEGVGKADFGAVDRAIAGGFDEREELGMLRIEDEGAEALL